MQWTRSITLPLAKQSCVVCFGLGLDERHDKGVPCKCVLREIFRICHEECQQAVQAAYPEKQQFAIDFQLVARRNLNENDHHLFQLRFLRCESVTECARRFLLERTDCYRRLYRIEETLGLLYSTLQPFALFPLSTYYAVAAA